MADVFISYKREDRDTARSIADALRARNYEVWWDIELLPGQKFSEEIKAIISGAGAAVVLWSEAAVSSPYVLDEATLSRDRGILIPARLDNCELPLGFGGLHTLDLSEWLVSRESAALQPLVRAVESKLGRKEAPTARPAEEGVSDLESEAQFWREIAEHDSQSFEEYELYLAKYGEHALFSDLARLRVRSLRSTKVPSSRSRLKRLLAPISAAVVLLTGIATLVIKGNDVIQIFRPKEATVAATSLPPAAAASAPTSSSSVESTAPAASSVAPASTAPVASTVAPAPAPTTPPETATAPKVSATSAEAAAPEAAPVSAPAAASYGPPTTTAGAVPAASASSATTSTPTDIGFLSHSIKYELRFVRSSKEKADRIQSYFKEKGLTIEEIPLYSMPANVSNKIYYTKADSRVAVWLQESFRDISSFELVEYMPTDNASKKTIRITLGD